MKRKCIQTDSRELLNPYGLRDGRIISIEDLDVGTEYGKRCKCICPRCKAPLVARIRGRVRMKHFAHDGYSDCVGGYESALHILVKEVIEEGSRIKLPPVYSSLTQSGFFVSNDAILYNSFLSDAIVIKPDVGKTEVEKDLGKIRPDVIVESSGSKLFIEVLVTHAVDEEKRKLIQEYGTSCIEVDFSYYRDVKIDKNCIRNALAGKDSNVNISWIYNKKQDIFDTSLKTNSSTFWILDHTRKLQFRKGMKFSYLGTKRQIVKDRTQNGCPLKISKSPSITQLCLWSEHVINALSLYNEKNQRTNAEIDNTFCLPDLSEMVWNQIGLNDCLHCNWNRGALAKLDSSETEFIICGKNLSHNEEPNRLDCILVLGFAKECVIPESRDMCATLIHSLVKTLGKKEKQMLTSAVNEAIDILTDRFDQKAEHERERAEKELKEKKEREKLQHKEHLLGKQKNEKLERERKQLYDQQGKEWKENKDKLEVECHMLLLSTTSYLFYRTFDEWVESEWRMLKSKIPHIYFKLFGELAVKIVFKKVAKNKWKNH